MIKGLRGIEDGRRTEDRREIEYHRRMGIILTHSGESEEGLVLGNAMVGSSVGLWQPKLEGHHPIIPMTPCQITMRWFRHKSSQIKHHPIIPMTPHQLIMRWFPSFTGDHCQVEVTQLLMANYINTGGFKETVRFCVYSNGKLFY